MPQRIAVAASLIVLLAPAWAAIPRSAAERAAFLRENPCPSTGLRRGACPGFEVDHVTPLCAGGADHRSNLQWLSVSSHRSKTAVDLRVCRRLRTATPP